MVEEKLGFAKGDFTSLYNGWSVSKLLLWRYDNTIVPPRFQSAEQIRYV